MSDTNKRLSVSTDVKTELFRVNVFTHDFYQKLGNNVCYNNDFSISAKADRKIFNDYIQKLNTEYNKVCVSGAGKNTDMIFTSKQGDAVVRVSLYEDPEPSSLGFITSSKEIYEQFNNDLGVYDTFVEDTSSQVFLLHKNMNGFYLRSVGTPVLDFNPSNYEENIVSAFEELKTRITEPNPFGRLTIIEGPPGTGKTSFIRALLTGNKTGLFIIFPINLLNAMDSSDLIQFLAEQSQSFGKPVVLILEDADVCLLPREEGSLSFISTLLNATDGIIGSCVDNRIIATTNAAFSKIDPAITRPGRLLKHVQIGTLSKERATAALRALSKDATVEATGPMTLAEVYEKSYKLSNNRKVEVKKKIGF